MIAIIIFTNVVIGKCSTDTKQKVAVSDSMYVIQKMALGHCARGSKQCEKCKELSKEKRYCLIKIFTESDGKTTRPVMGIYSGKVRSYVEYEVERTFVNKAEATLYASKNNIPILNASGR